MREKRPDFHCRAQLKIDTLRVQQTYRYGNDETQQIRRGCRYHRDVQAKPLTIENRTDQWSY